MSAKSIKINGEQSQQKKIEVDQVSSPEQGA